MGCTRAAEGRLLLYYICICCFGSYRLYLLNGVIQMYLFDGEYSGGRRPPPLILQLYLLDRVIQMYLLNGWLGHTDVFVEWLVGSYRCICWTWWSINIHIKKWVGYQFIGHTDVFLVLGHTDCICWLYFLDGEYSGGRRPPPLVLQLYFLFGSYRLYFLVGVIQIVFVGRGHTDVFVGRGGRLTYISRNE